MRLSILQDETELEGTQEVIIRTDSTTAGRLGDTSASRFVILRNGDRRCGAILRRIEAGGSSIKIDKYLRIYLRAQSEGAVEVEFCDFPPALAVEVMVPAEYKRKGLTRLMCDSIIGRPLSEGQAVPLLINDFTVDQPDGEIVSTNPGGIVVVTRQTEITFREGRLKKAGITWKDIGGLGREIARIREMVEYPIRYPEVFQRYGISPPRGIILHGPPGTGKTLIAKALASEVGASVHIIQGPEIMSAWYGGSEQNLRQVFEQAKSQAPAIILIDELDSIAPRRDKTHGEVEHRVVATLLVFMDGLSELKDVVVIGTTNAVNTIDPALRRPGRFEHEIHIGLPDTDGRREILEIHTRRMPLSKDVKLDALAEKTYGFVGADLTSLCREAAYCALRKVYRQKEEEMAEVSAGSSAVVTDQDFVSALGNIKPSAMREVMVEIPRDVSWDSIGGLEDVKKVITENVVYGMQKREAFLSVGIKPAKGMLLYGPPGTGKTLVAKVVAIESGANFITVRGPEIYSKWLGESEEKIRFIFSKAREVSPCVIFFDEIDAVASARGRNTSGTTDSVVNQLLTEMDGIEKNDNIFVIGATNRAELVDPALLRPGRFDYQVFVPLPDKAARMGIFTVHLRNKPVSKDIDLAKLADLTEGFSGADIAEVSRLATLDALRSSDFNPEQVEVSTSNLEKAIMNLKETKNQLVPSRMGFRAREEER